MTEQRRTTIIAALVTLFVFAVYLRTTAPTVSLWDCGEFIATSFTVGVMHPPGAPLYTLLGRIFSMIPTDSILRGLGLFPADTDLALRVNVMSPIAGALSALFTYLVILKLILAWKGLKGASDERWSAHFGAVVGTLIFAFSYSNWFNAVEAEVYAYAIMMMMMALYLALLWFETRGKPIHLSLALFMAYLMGLSAGLHLLSLLVLPSIGLLALFRYVGDDDEDDHSEALLLTIVMATGALFVMGTAGVRMVTALIAIPAGLGLIYLAITRQRDAWITLLALGLLGLGAYFAMHVSNASRLIADAQSEPAALYGISDDPVVYRQIAVALALIFGGAGVGMTFLTKSIKWRDTWTAIFLAGAGVATVKVATGLFFYIEAVGTFPTTSLVGGAVCGIAVMALRAGDRRPMLDALRGYHLIVAVLIIAVLGYSTYFTIKIRSGLNPMIDMNNPETWQNLFYMLARKQYGDEEMSMIIFGRRASFDYQFWHMLVKYLLVQFPASLTGSLFNLKVAFRSAIEQTEYYGMRLPDVPILLAGLGMFWHFRNDRKRFVALFALFLISGIGLSIYLNMPDPQPRERHYVFTGATSVLAIWMGMGSTGLIRWVRRNIPASAPAVVREKAGPIAVATLCAVVPLTFLVGYPLVDEYSTDRTVRYDTWSKHDRRFDTVGYDYAYNTLMSCDPNAILFTNGDNDTYPLWYAQDVVGIRKDVRIVNLSLLNTDWYIEQLRDKEPRIPMSARYTDEYIVDVLCGMTLDAVVRSGRTDVDSRGSAFNEDGRLIGWQPKMVRAAGRDTARIVRTNGSIAVGNLVRETSDVVVVADDSGMQTEIPRSAIRQMQKGFTGIEWTMPRPPGGQILRVQDVMVYNIIHWNNWERPIYFAVTVGSGTMGLDRYLRMQGSVFELARMPDLGVNIDRSLRNLEDIYQMRYLNDAEAYKSPNMDMFVSNYRVAYLQQADAQIRQRNDIQGARETLERLMERLPQDWRGAYSAAVIARRSVPGGELNDIASRFAQASGDVLLREIEQSGGLDLNIMERVNATAQVLRYSGAPLASGDFLASIEPMTRDLAPASGLNVVARIGVLQEASRSYREGGDEARGVEYARELRDVLSGTFSTPVLERQLRDQFGVSLEAFRADVERQIDEMERAMNGPDVEEGSDAAPTE